MMNQKLTPPFVEASADYALIEQAIRYLEENFQAQPDLADIAAHVGLSEYHFQRLFTRWAGISPKKFLQCLTLDYAKSLLAEAHTLLDATFETGLSSPGRLHDLFVTHEGMTPGEYKQAGAGLTIRYGFQPTPFGEALLALTDRGICGLQFVPENGRSAVLQTLQAHWPEADWVERETEIRPYVEQIFSPQAGDKPLPLHLKGTNFQVRVWRALLQIPPGMLASYGTVAQMMGQPQAARAVGNANNHNPIAYLIPCHRVIQRAGGLGGYRWGETRKKAMIGWEAAYYGTAVHI